MADENNWDFKGDLFIFFSSLNFALGMSILQVTFVMFMLDTDQGAMRLRSIGNKPSKLLRKGS